MSNTIIHSDIMVQSPALNWGIQMKALTADTTPARGIHQSKLQKVDLEIVYPGDVGKINYVNYVYRHM